MAVKKILSVKVSDLTLDPNNARKHGEKDIAAIAASLEKFSQQTPIVITSDNVVIKGNGTLMAAMKLNWTHIDAIRTNLTGQQVTAYALADNQTGLLSTWDNEKLLELLQGLDEQSLIDACGFDEMAMAELLKEVVPELEPENVVDEDVLPEAPAEPITKAGDLWRLGEHLLLCGDSRVQADVDKLLGDHKVNLAFTSPPYASQREYDASSGFRPIPPDEYVEWWDAVQSNVARHLAADGSFFVNIKPSVEGLDTHLYVMDLVIAHVRQWGWHFATEFCWERSGIPKGVTRRFKNQFEPIYQFVLADWKMRPDAVRHESSSVPKARGKGAGNTSWGEHQGGIRGGVNMANHQGEKDFEWFGDNVEQGLAYPGNRLPPFSGSHEALGHAAAFPVGLPAFFIRAYTDKGDSVYEPFCGSGSTLIAAENHGRRCFGMEISPAYCDIIVQRWEKLTGKKAVLQPASVEPND